MAAATAAMVATRALGSGGTVCAARAAARASVCSSPWTTAFRHNGAPASACRRPFSPSCHGDGTKRNPGSRDTRGTARSGVLGTWGGNVAAAGPPVARIVRAFASAAGTERQLTHGTLHAPRRRGACAAAASAAASATASLAGALLGGTPWLATLVRAGRGPAPSLARCTHTSHNAGSDSDEDSWVPAELLVDRVSDDYFAVFGMAPSFELDDGKLHKAFQNVQRRLHPDRFTLASDDVRRRAAHASAYTNEAYTCLASPVTRAAYMLKLNGLDALGEGAKLSEQPLLHEMLEKRSALADVETTQDAEALLEDARADVKECVSALGAAFRFGELETAATLTVRLQYYVKLMEECEASLLRLRLRAAK